MCYTLKVLRMQKVQSWQLEKIRGQASRQADRQTNRVTSSLLELLVAAKNMSFSSNIISGHHGVCLSEMESNPWLLGAPRSFCYNIL